MRLFAIHKVGDAKTFLVIANDIVEGLEIVLANPDCYTKGDSLVWKELGTQRPRLVHVDYSGRGLEGYLDL